MDNAVKRLRNERGVSISELSRETGISRSVLYLFEQGRRDVRISTALRVAAALKCTLNDLFN